MSNLDLLIAIGKIPAAAWDAIIPKYRPGLTSRVERAGLNPQPLPPKVAFASEVGAAVHHFVGMAIDADVRDEKPYKWVSDVIDDWCGTKWPRKWPFPPIPEPEPDPWWLQQGQLIGAVVLASYASRLREGELQGVLSEGAVRLAEAAMQQG